MDAERFLKQAEMPHQELIILADGEHFLAGVDEDRNCYYFTDRRFVQILENGNCVVSISLAYIDKVVAQRNGHSAELVIRFGNRARNPMHFTFSHEAFRNARFQELVALAATITNNRFRVHHD